MLPVMGLVDQWREIEARLPEGWDDACLLLAVADDGGCDRAAFLLGPASPGRRGKEIRFYCARRGPGLAPELVRRLLGRLDAERIEGRLELVSCGKAAPAPAPSRSTLAESWDAAVAALPADWTDLYCELELTSTDHLERAALLAAPLNPARYRDRPAFRFRVARRFGYGASAGMARRCLVRLDEERIPGEVRILRALSDTSPVGTQGPVWYVEGRAV